MVKSHHTHTVGRKQQKSGRNFSSEKIILQLVQAAEEAAEAARSPTHAQCFQIWQVSAKYCTFLDFLPIVMPIVHKSFWKHPSMRTKFWVTQ